MANLNSSKILFFEVQKQLSALKIVVELNVMDFKEKTLHGIACMKLIRPNKDKYTHSFHTFMVDSISKCSYFIERFIKFGKSMSFNE